MSTTKGLAPPELLGAAQSQETDGYRRLTWSYDGSCLIAQSASHKLQTSILPSPCTVSSPPQPLPLSTALSSSSTLRSFVPWPYFTLTEPSTTLLLHSSTHMPIQLIRAFPFASHPNHPPPPTATYPLILPHSEAFLPAHALTFTHHGAGILAAIGREGGGLAAFDVTRSGEGPAHWARWPRNWRGVEMARDGAMSGMRGIGASVRVSFEGLAAVGTLRGCVGLYGGEGWGEGVAAWGLEGEGEGGRVTQVEWSGCGRYLYVGEGKSDGVRVYDVRVEGRLLGMLVGRGRTSNLVQEFAVERTESGEKVWAGGMDGCVRVWEDCHSVNGKMEPSEEFRLHEDPVTSIVFDSGFTRLATCSAAERGQQEERQGEADIKETERDPMIKIYSNVQRCTSNVKQDDEDENT
ncbi:hypothetical protein P152DRAFT_485957 [Eremomyces bilateralis CBS 781.70]|uniref:WD40 repeat-like protein n=1 Tax=Eremomyces bilateralis CBS 781.70 TaxID=1392243 RepID=A0A6G1GFH1_9PEZI|nr:uncharacterized protein P152DRAFT_485957 [Eremomyces bilateralis CBS 781.70]KAF1816774.1 hypothetical protein P152DRAFT_485957 [Eremomyces bilateralis CBS 781.70]